MNNKMLTLEEIRKEGTKALIDRLGVADTLRFFMQYEHGTGNYTKERHQWIDSLSMDEIVQDIENKK